MFYKVDEKVLQGVINYLASKPFAEVQSLIVNLQQSQPIKEDDKVEDKEEA